MIMDEYYQIFKVPKENLMDNDFLDVNLDLPKWSVILCYIINQGNNY